MNTPSHLVINLAILRRPQLGPWPILLGAIVPDAAIFIFFGWAQWGQRLPPETIWREAYYEPFWQNIFAVGNSIPFAAIGLLLCYRLKRRWAMVFFASMLLHQLADLPLHHDDAHRHFWPLSELRIISPVSYWDPDHFGRLGAGLETCLVVLASVFLWGRVRSHLGRGLLLLTSLVLMGLYMGFYLIP